MQGCFDELQALLQELAYDGERDRLWFVGDLVNRGPHSLEVLRFVKGLGERAVTVLGNHDLHLLAVAAGIRPEKRKDTFGPILSAPDREDLLHWLRHRPLFHYDAEHAYALVHAGLAPQWNLSLAQACAAEVEAKLRSSDHRRLLRHMYGDTPTRWSPTLNGWERQRFVINCLTRMRYCDARGRLNLRDTGPPGTQRAGDLPWFEVPGRASADLRIVFGHWSALPPEHGSAHGVVPLDEGCIWGRRLSALRLEDGRGYSVECQNIAPMPLPRA